MLIPKTPRIRDAAYLKAVRDMPCIITGDTATEYMSIVPHHVTLNRFSAGMKAGDNHALPLRQDLHRELHQDGEQLFWAYYAGSDYSAWLGDALKALAEQYYDNWKG